MDVFEELLRDHRITAQRFAEIEQTTDRELVLLSHKIRDCVFKIDDHRKMWYLSLSSSGSGDRNGQRIEWGE
jgi:hypothetical protein